MKLHTKDRNKVLSLINKINKEAFNVNAKKVDYRICLYNMPYSFLLFVHNKENEIIEHIDCSLFRIESVSTPKEYKVNITKLFSTLYDILNKIKYYGNTH